MSRVPLVETEDLPPAYRDRELLTSQAIRPGEPLRLLGALGNAPALLEARLSYSASVRKQCGLSTRERELVVLQVAATLESAYVWHQHVLFAGGDLLSEREIRAIRQGEYERFAPEERVLLRYVSCLLDRDVDDAIHARLVEAYGTETVVGVVLLATAYVDVATLIDAFDIEPESPFVGWLPEGLDDTDGA